MINSGSNILFNHEIDDIDARIRKALKVVADALLAAYGLAGVNLKEGVTAKTNLSVGFSKYVMLGALHQTKTLGWEYLLNIHDIYLSGKGGRAAITNQQFETFMAGSSLEFRSSFMPSIRAGCGLVLVRLHCNKVITLPSVFNWPTIKSGSNKTARAASVICSDSELLSFVRSCDEASDSERDPAFAAVGRHKKQIEWFSTYATKLLLSTGWHTPEEANAKDLLVLRRAEEERGGSTSTVINAVQSALIDSMQRKFGVRCPIGKGVLVELKKEERSSASIKNLGEDLERIGKAELLKAVAKMKPALAYPNRMKQMGALAGLDFDLRRNSSYWIELQDLYQRKVRREDYKQVKVAFGLLNLYLFFYLPHWNRHHPHWTMPFPSTPNRLVGSVFVSRLLDLASESPATLVEFLELRASQEKLTNETAYGYLKQVEKFFDFIVLNSDSLEGCQGFTQPLSQYDFPGVRRSIGTNKAAFPRRLFNIFVAYIESIKGYVDTAIEKVAEGEVAWEDLDSLIAPNQQCVDTQKRLAKQLIGASPYVEVDGERIEIRYLPFFPPAGWYTLKRGKAVKLPRPNALNQILVALYTGLRHNHIQWLDADSYDYLVQGSDTLFTRLLVNTDKVKRKAWAADVNRRVIEILHDQKSWRDLVTDEAFSRPVHYNGNEQTAYPQFRPLFAYDVDRGHPHNDSVYAGAWSDLLIGFQTWANEQLVKGDDRRVNICRLAAPSVDFVDADEEAKLLARFSSTEKEDKRCPLRVATDITPHSTRVTVCTTLSYFLSPDLIGKRVTGQEVGTVAYYVRPAPEDLETATIHQALDLQNRALKNHVGAFLSDNASTRDPTIKAASMNSALARSMKVDINQTIVRFGCMSIAIGDEENCGLNVLAEVGASRVAYNTTEICPYNNVCPQRVLEITKGVRRCSLCPAAVRSIDHLPAIVAVKKRTLELISDFTAKIEEWETSARFTDRELDEMEEQRQALGEDLAGWHLCEAVLEAARARLAAGTDSRAWIVEQPEIIEKDLRRVEVQTDETLHLLARLSECTSYPGFTSPKMERAFDMYRRRSLILSGDMARAVGEAPINPAAECAGLLRSLVAAKRLTVKDVISMLTTERHLEALPPSPLDLSPAGVVQ